MKKNIIWMMFLLCGCFSNRTLIGKYASHDNNNAFQFKSDSTFLNESISGHSLKYSTGKWKKTTTDKVFLTSKIESIKIPLKLVYLDSINVNNSNLKIDLNISHGLDLKNYHCYIYLNDRFLSEKRCDSINSIELTHEIKTLYLIFSKDIPNSIQYTFPLNTEKVIISKPLRANVEIKVSFDDLYFTYNAFNNEIIKLKKGYIEVFNTHLNKWQRIPKVANKTNIFIHW